MQISAANLLIASQPVAHGLAQPQQPASFAAVLKDKGVDAAGFEPMAFKQTAAPKPAAPQPAPATGYGAGTRLGANLDIRV